MAILFISAPDGVTARRVIDDCVFLASWALAGQLDDSNSGEALDWLEENVPDGNYGDYIIFTVIGKDYGYSTNIECALEYAIYTRYYDTGL